LVPYLSPEGAQLVAGYASSAIAYTVYLYYNFSGYMDIVIGVGWLLGQDLPENFNKPFLARDFLEFWTRWHMTLSQWFKTYLFNPLMSLLIDRFPQPVMVPYLGVTAFFVTFFVMGIWHGTTPVFAVYGALMGAGASINKLWQLMLVDHLGRQKYRLLGEKPLYAYACRGLTCSFFAIGITCLWVNMDQLRRLWGTLGPGGLSSTLLLIAAFSGFAMFLQDFVVRLARKWLARPALLSEYGMLGNFWSAAEILIIVIVSTFFHKTPEFVYRAF
jgi:D-alanyl-lipoteichoic acid acyltransferase DltB (MBOAT superfamily)